MREVYYDKLRRVLVLNYHYKNSYDMIHEEYALGDVLHIWQPVETPGGYCMTIELRNRNKAPQFVRNSALCKFRTFPASKEKCFDMFFQMSNDYHESMMRVRAN